MLVEACFLDVFTALQWQSFAYSKMIFKGNVDFVHASRRSLSLSVYFCTPVGITSVLLFVWEPVNAAEMDNFVTTLELMAWQKRAKSTLGQLVAMLVRPSSWIRVALFG